ncbi:MAG: sulfatase-like hydrolase/transferase [Deltaproteobacteria bacterium]|nr:sulfatase-like hydrolase/transferase [Deltaproteobacteria bacterium]
MSRPVPRLLALLPVVTASLLVGCGAEPRSKELSAPRPSLVLITLDTTRADRIGAYGHSLARTPTIDGLAAQGARFDRAYAVVPLTTPSHASMLSGVYPTRHGVHNNGDAVLPDRFVTLAERLQAQGWRTGASLSAFVTTRIWNLDQGFDVYLDDVRAEAGEKGRWGRERPAKEVIDDAIRWLEAPSDAPFFLWVHLFDAHAPYDPPSPFKEQHEGRPYDGEIAAMDAEIARLQAVVDRVAGPAGAAWIVIGDHGEALQDDHGERDHGTFLFDGTARVPLIARPAAPLAQGVVVQGAVSGVDVTPTAMGLLGLPPDPTLDGVDLSPALRGEALNRAPVYLEAWSVYQRFGFHPELAVAQGDLKLMDTPNPRLFDLRADPGETQNLAAARPEDVARLRAALVEIRAKEESAERLALAPEMSAQLAALGYVTGGADPTGAALPTIDAKDELPLLRQLEQVGQLLQTPGGAPEAERLLREVLSRFPELAEARGQLAVALRAQGRMPEALAVYEDALNRTPDSAILRTNYAQALAGMGRLDDALAEVQRVLVQVPEDDVARGLLVQLLRDLGRAGEALTLTQAWLDADPTDPNAQAQVGVLLSLGGEPEAGEPLLVQSLSDAVPRPQVRHLLGMMAVSRGDHRAAVAHLRAELDSFPASLPSRVALAHAHMALEEWEEAAAEYSAALGFVPEDVELRRALAQAYFNMGDYGLAAEALAPALAQAPEHPYVLLLHANILAKQGDRATAERVFAEAQALRARTSP